MTMVRGSVLGLVLLLVAGCAGKDPAVSTPRRQTISADLDRAVAVAISAAQETKHPLGDYRLTSAEQILHQGKSIWRITFKPSRLLPADPSKELIGAGGEIFVNVDLEKQAAEVRYGE